MKTILQGKNLEVTYSVNFNQDENGKFKGKPYLKKETKIASWETIEENNDIDNSVGVIHLSEDEYAYVLKTEIRADLNAKVFKLDKVLSTKEIDKELAEGILVDSILQYNKQKINDNPTLQRFCELFKLDINTTDVDDLETVLRDVIKDYGKNNKKDDLADAWAYAHTVLHNDAICSYNNPPMAKAVKISG